MPTTTLVTPTVSVNTIGARTDSAGAAVTDLTAEELRFSASIFGEGYLVPATAWRVQAQTVADMTVKVGSGTAKADHYVVAGEVAGQGNYIVRLDAASQNVTIPAAHASLARVDEIYLVVRDNVYDASARALPQLGHRQGDNGAGNPGPDAAWKASALLARVTVGAAVTTITSGVISDQRVAASGLGIQPTLFDAKGDLIVASTADVASRVAVGSNGRILMADSAQTSGVTWAPAVVGDRASVAISEGTSSASYGDLATPGPSVTVTVGPLGIALVSVTALTNFGRSGHGLATFACTGANTVAAQDVNSMGLLSDLEDVADTIAIQASTTVVLTGLVAGSTTFVMKYRALVPDSVFFNNRKISVLTF